MTPPSDPRPPQARREQILQAARRVCERRGFDAARMEEIAAEARVSKGTLYRFFPSKDELLLASLLDAHRRAQEGFRPPPEPGGADLEQMLRAQVELLPAVTRQMTANLQAWGVVARDAGLRERLYEALRTVYAERSAAIAGAVRAGIRAGRFRADVDAGDFVASVIALCDGLLYRSTFDPDHASPKQLRASLDSLLASIRVDGPAGGFRG